MLEEDKLGLGSFGCCGILEQHKKMSTCPSLDEREEKRRTKIFFSATNTLGADTTATVISAVAPSSSSLASNEAVSSEYCTQPFHQPYSSSQPSITQRRSPLQQCSPTKASHNHKRATTKTHPELTLVPVLTKGLHRQGLRSLAGMLLLGLSLQLGELLGALIALGIELLQGIEGGGRERAGEMISILFPNSGDRRNEMTWTYSSSSSLSWWVILGSASETMEGL